MNENEAPIGEFVTGLLCIIGAAAIIIWIVWVSASISGNNDHIDWLINQHKIDQALKEQRKPATVEPPR
jgi:hypothetical protein